MSSTDKTILSHGSAPTFSVSGQIVDADGSPMAGLPVRVFDQALRTETLLGEAVTNLEGRYEVKYHLQRTPTASKQSANLIVQALTPKGEVLAASPTLFNAKSAETVDLVAAGQSTPAQSEYERLWGDLRPALDKVPLSQLSADDVRFLSSEINTPALQIVFMILAHRDAARVAVLPEAIYGLFRQGLPTKLSSLLLQKTGALRQALESSVQQGLIPIQTPAQIDSLLAALKQPGHLIQVGSQEPIPAFEILKTTSLSPDQQAAFLHDFAEHDGAPEEFWQALRQGKRVSDAQINELQLTLQLGALTGNHPPLIRELLKHRPLATMSSLRDLTTLTESDWLSLIARAGVPGNTQAASLTPTVTESVSVTGATPEHTYAQRILRSLAATYPTAVIAADLTRAKRPEHTDVIRFFANCPDFTFEDTRIDDYLAQHTQQALAGVNKPATLPGQLKAMQRVYQVTPAYHAMQALLDAGLDSAFSISRMSQDTFVEHFGTALGGTTQAARYYAQAMQISDSAAGIYVNVVQSMNEILPAVIGQKTRDLKQLPNFTSLFGSTSTCATDECESVYGAAAYLVDLLQLINPPTGQKAIRQLRKRRPDIEHLQLTCENTNTELPYIDLVNEIMEFYVAHNSQLSGLPAHNTSDISADELSVNPQYLNQQAYDLLQTAMYPPSLPFNRPVAVARAYLEHLGSSRYEVMNTLTHDSTAAARQAIAAESLKISVEEFQLLTGKNFDGTNATPAPSLTELYGYAQPVYPTLQKGSYGYAVPILRRLLQSVGGSPNLGITLQFDQSAEDALKTFQHAQGLPSSGVVDAPTWTALEHLQPKLWHTFLSRVPEFLQHTGLGYSDLTDLLNTRWVNPVLAVPRAVITSADSASCDLDTMVLQRGDGTSIHDTTLSDMQNFLRLWRKLGWAMADLDQALLTLTQQITPDLLQTLAQVQRVATRLTLPVNQVLSFWSNLDTQGRTSLYLQLFQNKATLNPVDDAFRLEYAVYLDSLPAGHWPSSVSDRAKFDQAAKQLKFVGLLSSSDKQDLLSLSSQASYQTAVEQLYQQQAHPQIQLADSSSLASHIPAILAALRLSAADLALIQATTGLTANDTSLTLANLSQLYRYALLARVLQIRVSDLIDLEALSGVHPFAAADQTELFLDLVAKVQQSGFSVAQLNYLYRYLALPPASLAPAAASLLSLAQTLRQGLAKIAADTTPTADPTGELTRKKLGMLFESEIVDQAVHLIDGTALYVAPLDALPTGLSLPATVKNKVTHNAGQHLLQATGPLTTRETQDLLGASTEPLYHAAVNTLQQQPLIFIQSTFSGFLDVQVGARQLVSDIPSLDQNLNPVLLDVSGQVTTDETAAQTTAIANKFAYFLAQFLPYLNAQLSRSLVKQVLGAALGLDGPLTALLLETPGLVPSQAQPTLAAIEDFLALQNAGLSGYYYPSSDLSGGPTTSRIDASLAFDGLATSQATTIPAGIGSVRWAGRVLAPNNDNFAFYVHGPAHSQLWVDVQAAPLSLTINTTTQEWSSPPLALKAGQLYDLRLEVTQLSAPAIIELRWSGASTPKALIPSGALFPDSLFETFTATFTLLDKISLLVTGFGLTVAEVAYLAAHSGDFGNWSLAALPLERSDPVGVDQQAVELFGGWQKVNDFVLLRNSLPQGEVTLIDIFGATSLEDRLPHLQAGSSGIAVSVLQLFLRAAGADPALTVTGVFDPPTAAAVGTFQQGQTLTVNRIVDTSTWSALKQAVSSIWHGTLLKAGKQDALVAATGWDAATVHLLTDLDHLNISVTDFATTGALIHIQTCMALIERVGVSPAQLFHWATQAPSAKQAKDIARTVKAKYDDATWLMVGKSLNDALREQQRDALLAYILADSRLAAQGIRNSNQLFEYFLIDVDMNACMQTSRLKQAISSVQLFIQRCLMNLESQADPLTGKEIGVSPSAINADVWEWMKNYRIWEANREVFLYPENWIEPELRDDKSPFFEDLENELLQNNITTDTAEQAFLNYLKSLDTVARLDICGMYSDVEDLPDGTSNILHVIGRTRNNPPSYYYRQLIQHSQWTAWEFINLDIQSDHLMPVVYNRRLYLFWASFEEKANDHQPPSPSPSGNQKLGSAPASQPKTRTHWEIKLSWSEYWQNAWTPKITSAGFVTSPLAQKTLQEVQNEFHYQYTVQPVLDGVTAETVVALFLPTAETHFFRTTLDNSELVLKLYRRYSHSIDVLGVKYVDVSRHNAEVTGFESVGEFRLRGSRDEFTVFSRLAAFEDYDALDLPLGAETSFQDFAYETADAGSLTLLQTVLQHIQTGPVHYRIAHESQRGHFAMEEPYQRFFYEGQRRLYFVHPKLLPAEKVHSGDKILPNLDTPFGDPLGNQFGSGSGSDFGLSNADGTTGQEIYTIVPAHQILKFESFFHPFTGDFIRRLNRDGVPGLLKRAVQQLDHDGQGPEHTPTEFQTRFDPSPAVYSDYPLEDVDFENGAYALYNWELFFHVPMLIATQLSANQQFEDAQTWFHYIFNPTTTSKESSAQRYWNLLPFYNNDNPQRDQIQRLLTALASPSSDPAIQSIKDKVQAQITAWKNDPFNPHLIARMRITAYQKNVVFKYIDNLIAWGDQLFSQNTLETINEATLLYVLAYNILGPRPEVIPAPTDQKPQTYAQLQPHLDDFSNALVNLENEGVANVSGSGPLAAYPVVSPLAKGTSAKSGGAQSGGVQSAKSVAGNLYFQIPANTDMLEYWDTVADRLFKIRNCMNIEGVVQQLPLFEPPINPAILVRAAALGLDLSSVLNDINGPLPYYRFSYMLQKALDLTSELRALGGSLLAALEKKDAEALAMLRSTQEITILKAMREVKQKQIDEANTALEGLQRSRDVTNERLQYYAQIEFMNAEEDAYILMTTVAGTLQVASQALHIEAAGALIMPDELMGEAGFSSPVAVTKYGGSNVGEGSSAAAQALGAIATFMQMLGSLSATMGGHQRRWDDWKLQERLATKELAVIDKQIGAAEIRVAIAENEMQNQDKQIDNAGAIEDFLRNKFTNQDLYNWMISQLAAVYFQCYNLAYDAAKRAEKAYRFERGLTQSTYIQFGYWDNLHKGLLAGERLYQDLKRLELAFLDQNKRDYELTRHISMQLTNPLALITLKETGRCEIELPEGLFDADYPGHYMRRLKSVSLTLPCVVGPYTSLNCTLTMLSNKTRVSSLLGSAYAEDVENADSRFVANFAPLQSIATSQAQNDSGLFELNFHDDRYLPFEGGGAISRWRIDLPRDTNAFDFNTLTDVVLTLKYTAREGGDILRNAARQALQKTLADDQAAPLARLFSLKHEFPTDWYRFLHPADLTAPTQTITLDLSSERFPYLFRGRQIRISAVDVYLNFKDAKNNPLGRGLHVDLTASMAGSSGSLTTDQSVLSGMPHAQMDLQFSAPSSLQLSVPAADLKNHGIADLIDDFFVVCYYSAH